MSNKLTAVRLQNDAYTCENILYGAIGIDVYTKFLILLLYIKYLYMYFLSLSTICTSQDEDENLTHESFELDMRLLTLVCKWQICQKPAPQYVLPLVPERKSIQVELLIVLYQYL